MIAMQWCSAGAPTVGGAARPRLRAVDAAAGLIPLLLLSSVATAALAGPVVLSDAQMDAITAADSGQPQRWLAAGDRPLAEALDDAVRARTAALRDIGTAAQDTRTTVSADTAGARDAAAAAVRAARTAAADLRAAAGKAAQVPAAVGAATARDGVAVARSVQAAGPEVRGALGASDTALRDAAKAVARATEAAAAAVRVTPAQESRATVSVGVDKVAVRDAAAAVAPGTEAAAAAIRAAEHRVPADLGSGTARASQSVTAVTHSNGTAVKATATARASAGGTDRVVTKTAIRVSLRN